MAQPVKASNPQPISASVPSRNCGSCQKVQAIMMRCTGCLKAYYCKIECQRAAWPTHKLVCKVETREPEEKKAGEAAKTDTQDVTIDLERTRKRMQLRESDKEIQTLIQSHPYGDLITMKMNGEISQEEFQRRQEAFRSQMPSSVLSKADRTDEILRIKSEAFVRLKQEIEKKFPPFDSHTISQMIIKQAENALKNIDKIPVDDREKFRDDYQTLLEFHQALEKSPDHKQIIKSCMDKQRKVELEEILQKTWSKLPPDESKLRSDIWKKIDPLYEKAAQIIKRQMLELESVL